MKKSNLNKRLFFKLSGLSPFSKKEIYHDNFDEFVLNESLLLNGTVFTKSQIEKYAEGPDILGYGLSNSGVWYCEKLQLGRKAFFGIKGEGV